MDSPNLPYFSSPAPLYRIARKPNPWAPPEWANCQQDGTFGNRFDDSNGRFRVLYASSSPLGCFVETLSRFRRPPEGLEQVLAGISNAIDDYTPSAQVPVSWLSKRAMGVAESRKTRFADVYSSEWLAYLRRRLEPSYLLRTYKIGQDFDLAVLMSQQRRLTQEIASLIYELDYDGIFYQSRLGTDLSNWALFEPFELTKATWTDLVAEDPNLIRRFND